jgi:general secretion pathway protein N
MWNRTQTTRRYWLPVSSLRPKAGARVLTLLYLTTFGGAAAVAMTAIQQTDARTGPVLTNSAKPMPPNKAEPDHETAAGNPLWAIPIKVLAATRDRPLFSPTRRPPAAPAFTLASAQPPAARPPAEPDRPPLLLIGTAAGKTTAIAVFLDQKTSRTVRLRSGQSQYGWVLGAVYKKEVVLQKDHAVVYLPLSAAAAPVAATQVAEARHERRQR